METHDGRSRETLKQACEFVEKDHEVEGEAFGNREAFREIGGEACGTWGAFREIGEEAFGNREGLLEIGSRSLWKSGSLP